VTALAAATTPVPSPMAVTGVVSTNVPQRALVVRTSDMASSYERSTWRTAYQALRQAEESGWRTAGRTVWASTDTADKIASVAAGDPIFDGLLSAHFADPAIYEQFLGKPDLTCVVVLDREQHRFLSVKFRSGRKG
jgi:hypothetical protein